MAGLQRYILCDSDGTVVRELDLDEVTMMQHYCTVTGCKIKTINEPLCKDEGCDHYGTPHVCVNRETLNLPEIGERVGAISHATEDTVYLLGFGVYEGDHVPPPEAGGFNLGIANPRIKLDNGKTVYGCECWWGSEERIKSTFGTRKIVEVDIDDARKNARQS